MLAHPFKRARHVEAQSGRVVRIDMRQISSLSEQMKVGLVDEYHGRALLTQLDPGTVVSAHIGRPHIESPYELLTPQLALARAQSLLHAAACLKDHYTDDDEDLSDDFQSPSVEEPYPELSKDQLESIVAKFRSDLDLTDKDPLDSLQIDVEGVRVVKLTSSECLDVRTMRRLRDEACGEWSAMSVPLNASNEKWVVLLNDCHTVERQRVTLLEEYWHILMGHKLTKVARIAQAYGRTYDKAEEHDAYYLASATLLPKSAVQSAVTNGTSSAVIAKHFGTSPDLVEYRIKRLGLWREHVGKKVALKD